MRLTCLKCGHQMEVATGMGSMRLSCVCGQDYSSPHVLDTGIQPSLRAAERSRSRAFRAAGVVKNVGGFAFGISLLGILFFPLALVGAGVAIYTLTMMRGPLGRYSGRRAAIAAVVVGAAAFVIEGSMAMTWLRDRRMQRISTLHVGVAEDLRALLRAQRLFRATHDTYGSFKEFRFRPPTGRYTVYLGADDYIAAHRDGAEVVDPLPPEYLPTVSESSFLAVAVGNLDDDSFLDVWSLGDQGGIHHVADDLSDEVHHEPTPVEAAAASTATPPTEPEEDTDEPSLLPAPPADAPAAGDEPAPE